MIGRQTQRSMNAKLSLTWMQAFTENIRIVSTAHREKHRWTSKKELEIEAYFVTHLGTVSVHLSACIIYNDDVINSDETHFVLYDDDV